MSETTSPFSSLRERTKREKLLITNVTRTSNVILKVSTHSFGAFLMNSDVD